MPFRSLRVPVRYIGELPKILQVATDPEKYTRFGMGEAKGTFILNNKNQTVIPH